MTQSACERITLPTGYWVADRHYRGVSLRALTGADEEFLLKKTHGCLPVDWVTTILNACLCAMDGIAVVRRSSVEQLTVGDREALLLHLRRLSFGERAQASLACPAQDCGEMMDLDLRIGDLLMPSASAPVRFHMAKVGEDEEIEFRLPTGADEHHAAQIAQADPQAGVACLMRRCLKRDEDFADAMTAPATSLIEQRMAELDPQAELLLDLVCPACGHAFSTIFDAGNFLFGEIEAYAGGLYQQVHVLASHYHWSEAEILALPTTKRHGYLNLIADGATAEAWA